MFKNLIDSKIVSTPEELKAVYKKTLKKLHPDLKGAAVSHHQHDFDQIRLDYQTALRYLAQKEEELRAAVAEPAPEVEKVPPLQGVEAFREEFRELFVRGFPVNARAVLKNKAYEASIARVNLYLAEQFADANFFRKANLEAQKLKKFFPKIYWYLQQILWNMADYQATRFDYHRRIAVRHLDFIGETLAENRLAATQALLVHFVRD